MGNPSLEEFLALEGIDWFGWSLRSFNKKII